MSETLGGPDPREIFQAAVQTAEDTADEPNASTELNASGDELVDGLFEGTVEPADSPETPENAEQEVDIAAIYFGNIDTDDGLGDVEYVDWQAGGGGGRLGGNPNVDESDDDDEVTADDTQNQPTIQQNPRPVPRPINQNPNINTQPNTPEQEEENERSFNVFKKAIEFGKKIDKKIDQRMLRWLQKKDNPEETIRTMKIRAQLIATGSGFLIGTGQLQLFPAAMFGIAARRYCTHMESVWKNKYNVEK